MAKEMSVDTAVHAQLQFDALLDLLRGPGRLRRIGWFVERNRGPLMLVTIIAGTMAAHLAI